MMTNCEHLSKMSNEELSQHLCDLIGGCDFCKLYKGCTAKGEGFKKWLAEEREE